MPHTVEWNVHLDLFEDEGTTKARATLDTGTTTVTGRGVAMCAPGDRDIPEIGDEFAAGRALRDLGEQLLHTAEHDVAAVGAAPEPRRSPMYGWPL
ncbi:dsRBD fold-containing protein [Streptomyces roseoverticillatus]|uniref:dsRBD fold-containing protein n=1 Tax=Streptomyces roseoverticillatus TaxID=66429 RepID=UPI0004BFC20C|nr:dsRBD fold-containing protein [Streptomyces roseoverticillatus]